MTAEACRGRSRIPPLFILPSSAEQTGLPIPGLCPLPLPHTYSHLTPPPGRRRSHTSFRKEPRPEHGDGAAPRPRQLVNAVPVQPTRPGEVYGKEERRRGLSGGGRTKRGDSATDRGDYSPRRNCGGHTQIPSLPPPNHLHHHSRRHFGWGCSLHLGCFRERFGCSALWSRPLRSSDVSHDEG